MTDDDVNALGAKAVRFISFGGVGSGYRDAESVQHSSEGRHARAADAHEEESRTAVHRFSRREGGLNFLRRSHDFVKTSL
jgi:hypothetical protein